MPTFASSWQVLAEFDGTATGVKVVEVQHDVIQDGSTCRKKGTAGIVAGSGRFPELR